MEIDDNTQTQERDQLEVDLEVTSNTGEEMEANMEDSTDREDNNLEVETNDMHHTM